MWQDELGQIQAHMERLDAAESNERALRDADQDPSARRKHLLREFREKMAQYRLYSHP